LLADEPGAAAWLTRVALAVGDRGRAEAGVASAERLIRDNADLASVAAAVHARGCGARSQRVAAGGLYTNTDPDSTLRHDLIGRNTDLQ
jgi:hypothetical protein